MFGRRISLFKLLGFEIKIDLSWFLIAILIAWSLATGYFPSKYSSLSVGLYWLMGIIGAMGLFLSIIFHELSHSLVARRFGLPIKGITLFLFGGVAEMEEEPKAAKTEFYMALAGPFSSLVLAVLFYWLHSVTTNWTPVITGIFYYLAWINGLLALFNLLPAFPLDGGRMLRAYLWNSRKDLRSATNTASRIGSGFGVALIVMGVFYVLYGNFIGGLWWFLIGLFLRNASQASYKRLLTRSALEGEKVSRFMKTDPVTVPRAIPISDLVEQYVYRHHFKMFPVVENERLTGCISTKEIKAIPREDWERKTSGEMAVPCSKDNSIAPEADAMDALAVMSRTGNSRLMVAEGDRLVGIVVLKDLLDFLSLKLDLEGNGK